MSTLFTIGLLLIVAFGFAASAYLTFFSFKLQSVVAKGLVFIALGVVFSLVTFSISLFIVWPAAM